jgi:purine-binding chemotaxis protein CheW
MSVSQNEGTGQSSLKAKAGKYLTFKLGVEEYGLEILKVQEIIKMMDITHVPRTPAFVRGVINLRGKVIPVVDLRLKFGMESRETTDKTCVIVVQVAHGGAGGGSMTMGTIVDEVSEVLDIAGEQIEPAPEFGTAVNTDFILGMGKVAKKVVMLLDIDKVLSSGELATVSKVAKVA